MRSVSLAPPARALTTLAALATALAIAACGGGDSEDSSGEDGGIDPVAAAEKLAACTTEADLPGEVTEPTIPDTSAVDLTNRYQTMLVVVFASEDDAAGYENESGLDQEVIGNYAILGGNIKPGQHDIITGCLPR